MVKPIKGLRDTGEGPRAERQATRDRQEQQTREAAAKRVEAQRREDACRDWEQRTADDITH